MRQATDDEWALLTREADTEAPDRDAIFVDGVRILGADSVARVEEQRTCAGLTETSCP